MAKLAGRSLRYGIPVLAVAIAVALLALPGIGRGLASILFLAVFVSARFGGPGPGLLATALITALAGLELVLSRPELAPWRIASIVLFAAGGAGIILLVETLDSARRRAEASRQRLAAVLTSIGDAVITTDDRGRVSFVNPIAAMLTGWPAEEAAGRPLPEVFPVVDEVTGAAIGNPVDRVLREGMVVGAANHTLLIARDGTRRPIDDCAAPIKGEAGTIAGAVLAFRDVSGRRQAQAGQARLAAIVESSDDAIIGKDLDGLVTFWNAGAERLFGYGAAEIIGRPIAPLIPDDRRQEEAAILDRIRRGEGVALLESVRVSRDGRRVDVSLMISPIRDADGRITGASTIARDITERKRAEADLQQYADRLEALSRQLLRAQEDERRRIARELHDEVGQSLTAAAIALDRLARDPSGPELGRRLADAAALVRRALEQARDLSRLLSPAILEDLGLPEALRALIEGLAEQAGLAAEADVDDVEPADPEVELACYRIAQEALTNAVKHSGCTRLWLALHRTGEGLELVVEDDGTGFDVEAATARSARGSSLGMLSMQERAALAGGRAEIGTRPGGGTRVRAAVSAGGRAARRGEER